MTVTLYGWGGMFDLPSPSPYVAKADMQMQMLGIEFDRAIADLESVGKHKAPYVNDGGQVIEDSTFIRRHFEGKTGRDLDAGLSPRQRAVAQALGAMLENRLAQIMACERWLIDTNFDSGPRQFFAGVPDAMRDAVVAQVRDDFRRTMHGAGFGRHSRAELMQIAAADIGAVAALLGEQQWLFGDHPSAVDAVAYGVLAGSATRFFETELVDLIEAQPNLTAFIARAQQAYFPEDRWPRMS
ncbi:MAG: glutathione S-transferase family protein [Proteobacteria bacterium]|nr:glutathione S-transferase family protein [Pseudomonadota bacterium]